MRIKKIGYKKVCLFLYSNTTHGSTEGMVKIRGKTGNKIVTFKLLSEFGNIAIVKTWIQILYSEKIIKNIV